MIDVGYWSPLELFKGRRMLVSILIGLVYFIIMAVIALGTILNSEHTDVKTNMILVVLAHVFWPITILAIVIWMLFEPAVSKRTLSQRKL